MKSGRARVDTEVIDLSVLMATGLKGIHAVAGITERGDVNRTRLIGNWQEFTKYYGGLISESIFPLLCKRALERGAKLRVARMVHYTDPTNPTTIVGTKATGAINTTVLLEAASIGTWGNKLTLTVKAAANGIASQFDIDYTLSGSEGTTGNIIRNVPAVLTLPAIQEFNTKSDYIKIKESSATQSLAVGTATLSGGLETKSAIVLADYLGSAGKDTGIFRFDNDMDFVRISIPEMAVPEIDIALVAYVEKRKDCRAILRTPIGISGDTAVAYRLGTTPYTHVPINSWMASMWFGDLEVINELSEGKMYVSAIGDVAGCYSGKDNVAYAWFSPAGPKRGLIGNATGTSYNLASPAKTDEADRVSINGINAVVNDDTYGLMLNDNVTLLREDKMTKHENVAELLVWLTRSIRPLCKSELFDPNDIETWKTIYRKVNPLLQLMKDKRGIWDYVYDGDQNIDKVEEAVVNNPQDLDNGEYVFILWIKPKVALKYIGVKVVVTNSGTSFEEVQSQPVV